MYIFCCSACSCACTHSCLQQQAPGRSLTTHCATQLASSLVLRLIRAPAYLILTQKFQPVKLPNSSPVTKMWQPRSSRFTKPWNKITSCLCPVSQDTSLLYLQTGGQHHQLVQDQWILLLPFNIGKLRFIFQLYSSLWSHLGITRTCIQKAK